ncbi:hypothetical protein DV736_g1046, partial [Chaetothyriales sp. CBS 134916]
MDRKSHFVAPPALGLSNEHRHGSNAPWVPFANTYLHLKQLLELCQSEQQLRKEGYPEPAIAHSDMAKGKIPRPINLKQPQSQGWTELLGLVRRPSEKNCRITSAIIILDHSSSSDACAVPDASLSTANQPALLNKTKQRLAIAIDCEMGTAATGDSELIRLSAIDVFTKETLIDKIVKPEGEMRHLNTKYSGVTWKDIREAKARGDCFLHKEAARQALFRFVGLNTIIVTHGGSNDFNALRWIHPRIIDTFVLYQDRRKSLQQAEQLASDLMEAKQLNITVEEVQQRREAKAEADKLATAATLAATKQMDASPEPKKNRREKRAPGGLSLKALVKEYANIDIQTGYGHNSLEDAFGCRELAIRFILAEPEVSQYLARCNEPCDTS